MKNVEDIYRLSPVQEGMLFHTLNDLHSGVYVEHITCRLRGRLDVAAFRTVWQQMLDANPVLRSSFVWKDVEHPVQIVHASLPLAWRYEDWRNRSTDDCESSIKTLIDDERRTGFDPESAPLMRLALFRIQDDEHRFIWSRHHVLADGWSTQLIWQQVLDAYEATATGTSFHHPDARPFRDFIAWLEAQDTREAETYWCELLSGYSEPAFLQCETQEAGNAGCFIRHELTLSCHETTAIEALARRYRLTVSTLLTGVWSLLVSRYSGRDDVVFGLTSSGRSIDLPGAPEIVGPMLNTLPVRTEFKPDQTVAEWLAELQMQLTSSRKFEQTSLADIQRWSDIPAGRSLFDTIFVSVNYPRSVRTIGDADDGIIVDAFEVFENTNYPLAFLVEPGGELKLHLIADGNRFDSTTLHQLIRHAHEILVAMGQGLNQRIRDLPLVLASERQQQLVKWDAAPQPTSEIRCWTELFETLAKNEPNRPAVACGDDDATYLELNRRANRLGHHLNVLGGDRHAAVGICMERSVDLIVAIIAVLKAGRAYVPLDPSYPPQRLELMAKTAKVSTVVTHAATDGVWIDHSVQTINVDADREILFGRDNGNIPDRPSAADGAYIVFTSGSTGRPRGVRVTHGNLLASTLARFSFYAEEVTSFLLLSSVSFDSSVAGIFWTLAQGGLLAVPADDESTDPVALATLARRHRITHLLCIPQFYRELLLADADAFASLTTAIVAGESCPPDLAELHFAELPHSRLFNEYGPSEATVWCTVHECQSPANSTRNRVPIGRSIPGARVYVLDEHQLPVPLGVVGEIHVGGPGIAAGYVNDPAHTNDRFIPDPFRNDGGRLYRTGDLARFDSVGVLEFMGRRDHQIKIRGHRIELSEIETTLTDCPGVREAVVVAQSRLAHGHANGAGVKSGSTTDNGNATDRHRLILELTRLDTNTADQLLRNIEAETWPAAERKPDDRYHNRRLQRDQFEIRLDVRNDEFINPPRASQRAWLMKQALAEFADDLEHLDVLARRFAAGRGAQPAEYNIADATLTEQQIMEDWQTPLMRAMAAHVTQTHGDVLEIGFGRGISANFIQEFGVRSHTIVESNGPCIGRHFEPWRSRYADHDIRLIHSRWQDALDQLELYDGVFFHAFPLNEQEFIDYVIKSVTFAEHFFETAARHLRDGGIFTYLTTEIDTVSRRHQRSLFRWFRSFSATVCPVNIPDDTQDAWWADSMVVIRAEK